MAGRVSNATEVASVSVSASITALEAIDGESQARAYLDRLQADMAQPDELAALLAYLSGETLHGACRVIEKALEGLRHA